MNDSLIFLNNVLTFNIVENPKILIDNIIIRNINISQFYLRVKTSNKERYLVNPLKKVLAGGEKVKIEVKLLIKENFDFPKINDIDNDMIIIEYIKCEEEDLKTNLGLKTLFAKYPERVKRQNIIINVIYKKQEDEDLSIKSFKSNKNDIILDSDEEKIKASKIFKDFYTAKGVAHKLKKNISKKMEIKDIKRNIIQVTEKVFIIKKKIQQKKIILEENNLVKKVSKDKDSHFVVGIIILFFGILVGSLLNS